MTTGVTFLPSPFPPTIAEGKVFRATGSGEVLVYGLLPRRRVREAPIVTGAEAIQAVFKRSGAEHGVLGTRQGLPQQLDGGGWSQDFKSNLPLHGFAVVSVHPNTAVMTVSCSHPLAPSDYTQVESSVYWSEKTGAHIVSGEIRQFWLKQGGARGPLGLPTSDEMPAADGLGRRSEFEHGEVVWHYSTGVSIAKR